MKNYAFTMAEILLSLTIIGVVAAITLPSLTGNINERTWNTQRKALYARISQAIALMPALNGYGTLTEESSSGAGDAVDTATETFITDGLAKVLKINNICDNTHLTDCGVPLSYNDMLGSTKEIPETLYDLHPQFSRVHWGPNAYEAPNTNAAAFETQNGESIITYYNKNCSADMLRYEVPNDVWGGNWSAFAESIMCINFIYDLNGNKGPNTVGKDIGFITVLNASDSIVVAPLPASATSEGQYNWHNAAKACTNASSDIRLPNINELIAMKMNENLINLVGNSVYWSSSVDSSTQAIYMNTQSGNIGTTYKDTTERIRCIKR